MILNLDHETIVFLLDTNRRGVAARMTMNISQTFLNDTKNCKFEIVWQPAKIGRDFQIDLNLAAF